MRRRSISFSLNKYLCKTIILKKSRKASQPFGTFHFYLFTYYLFTCFYLLIFRKLLAAVLQRHVCCGQTGNRYTEGRAGDVVVTDDMAPLD